MLALVGCRGYRAFESDTQLELRRLTIVFGKNNSGKTTLTRLPLFIGAAVGSPQGYRLASGTTRFGSSFRDIASVGEPHPSISYWAATTTGSDWMVELQSVSRGLEEHIQPKRVRSDGDTTEFSLEDLSAAVGDPAFPASSAPAAVAEALTDILHIQSARPAVSPVYEHRPPLAATAEEVPYWLLAHLDLRATVDAWFKDNLEGMSVDVEQSDYGFRLVVGDVGSQINFASAGRGSQAILPVVTLLKAAQLGLIDPKLAIIEEPEAHLHPSAHTSVAELLAESSRSLQILAETHSENLILRLRRKIATNTLSSADLGLAYVDENHMQTTIDVDELGGVRDWPSGVFEYDVEEARAIVEARMRTIDGAH